MLGYGAAVGTSNIELVQGAGHTVETGGQDEHLVWNVSVPDWKTTQAEANYSHQLRQTYPSS